MLLVSSVRITFTSVMLSLALNSSLMSPFRSRTTSASLFLSLETSSFFFLSCRISSWALSASCCCSTLDASNSLTRHSRLRSSSASALCCCYSCATSCSSFDELTREDMKMVTSWRTWLLWNSRCSSFFGSSSISMPRAFIWAID